MGVASKIVSVICRGMELISAAIVAGLVGSYLHRLSNANVGANGRIVYTEVIAGISIGLSIILMPPLKYSFFGFPLDFALFVCWMVDFGLLENLNGSHGCNSYWVWNGWGWYWYYWYPPTVVVNQSMVGSAACSKWRAVLAWSFIGGMFWLVSTALGIYVVARDRQEAKVAKAGPPEMQQPRSDNAAIV